MKQLSKTSNIIMFDAIFAYVKYFNIFLNSRHIKHYEENKDRQLYFFND